MRTRTFIVALIGLALLCAGVYGVYRIGMNRGMEVAAPARTPAAPTAATDQKAGAAADRKVLYWHDPMVPGQKFDKPGKSPFMDMDLVPVYSDAGAEQGTVAISPRVQQNLGVRTAEVTTGTLDSTVEAVGSVAFNERDVALVQARANGYIEKLFTRAPLDPVRKGQSLAELYVSDWVAAQEEYLSVRRMSGTALEALIDGARQRMRLAGMTEEQIRLVETSGKLHPRLSIVAPIGGVVAELTAREGMTVMTGAPLFRINGLGTVWVNAELPEAQAGEVRSGNDVEARTPSLPGSVFKGRVSAILPEVSPATRTLKVRMELANPRGQLIPGMFVTVSFTPARGKDVLLVPSEAVIRTGRRNVVMVAQDQGHFVPAEVQIGREADGRTEIVKGLQAGQKIVTSGQFLIDSEASLRGTEARLGSAGNESPRLPGPSASEARHRGTGKVESIGKDEITFSHGPIPSLKWGPMTMGFKASPQVRPKNIAVGDTVSFEFRQTPDGAYEVTSISPAPDAKSAIKGMPK
ncbi:MAG: efflux transporter periplasmic adaptor subunit [Betaproteobacteria bacterium]|nr:efflux transporter periplasmic adaptor subunit [Betaproteobacteria bacterium]